MKKKLKRIVSVIAFLGCFLILFYFVDSILKFKYEDGVQPIDHFYDLPQDTVDVLLLGSSHMGMNIDPSILWKEQGLAAYSCWGGMQPTWNTYYYLNECLKYQTPKLVVMDTYLATNDLEYDSYENMVKNIVGMRMSPNKLDAIRVSVSPEYRASVLLGLPTYHYRYASLGEEDFEDFIWNKETKLQSIASSAGAIQAIHIEDYSGVTETEELSEKLGLYLMKIIDLCEERKIPLLLVASPYELKELEQKRYNKIEKIAEEHHLPFLNLNNFYQQIGINTETDFRDPGHMNDSGIKKYSTYLANYIRENYEVPDRRMDPDHIWNQKMDTAHNRIYHMDTQFVGGGLNYLDTEVKLYENPFASYTLLTQIDTNCLSENKVWLSCFSEDSDNYRGLLVRREKDTIYVALNALSRVPLTGFGDTLNLAVIKNGLNYKVYQDGELAGELTLKTLDAYDGTLLVGCQVNEDNKRFRYSSTKVQALEIYDIALDENIIKEWEPEELPMPKTYQTPEADGNADFELMEQFIGNGYDRYLDTGMALYTKAEDSWTVLAQFAENSGNGAGVYFSCFNEEENNYHGLLVRHVDPGNINIMYGNHSANVEVPVGSDITFAITKDKYEYSLYVNEKQIVEKELVETDTYGGNLLIGCQELPDGEKMRFSGVQIYNLEIHKGIVAREAILAWKPEYKEMPVIKEPSKVDFDLDTPFMGDGKSECRNTGIKLYDTDDKSWKLHMKFRKNGEGSQTLATCFAENPQNYRGLIITMLDKNTLSLTLGQRNVEVELPPQPEIELDIVKKQYEYTISINNIELSEKVISQAPEYDGELYLGCAIDSQGKPFRYSKAMIMEFYVKGES